jgi:nicotinamidase-related amidase
MSMRESPVVPAETALLVVDMQNDECRPEAVDATKRAERAHFYDRLATVVIPNQVRLIAAAREGRVEVVYTVIESLTLDGRDRSLDHKISGLHVPKGSWQGRVIDELVPQPNEIVIPKTSSGVFNSTNIDYVLRNLGIRFLVVVGVVTDQCVESAIRDAADRGYLVTQVEDACAAYSSRTHDDSIQSMDGHYCRRRSTLEVIEEIAPG